MKKVFLLLLVLLLALGSFTCFIILTDKIDEGNLRVAIGRQQISAGEEQLANGKNRLGRGKRTLAEAETFNRTLKYAPVVSMSILPITAGIYAVTKYKVSQGKKRVAAGQSKIRSGEERLAAGKQELDQGMAKLKFAEQLRYVFAALTVFFSTIFLALCFYFLKSKLKKLINAKL